LNEKIASKFYHNFQNIFDEVLTKAKLYLTNASYTSDPNEFLNKVKSEIKDYSFIFHKIYLERYCEKCDEKYTTNKWCKPCQINYLKRNFTNWTSENKQIDDFIQKEQLQIENPWNIIFEWIPYSQFISIEKIENIGAIAIWKDGPLIYNAKSNKYERNFNKKVALKYLYDSQNIPQFLNKVSISYGISQNPDTMNYIIVFHEKYFEENSKYCEKCGKKYIRYKWCKTYQINYLKSDFTNWTSGNNLIDDFIQKKQLQIEGPRDIIFEWIPYDQFNEINEMGNIGAIAIWKDGPLIYNVNLNKYIRNFNKKVSLKYLYNSQNISLSNELLNKVESKDISYGISQNPDTKNYIFVFHENYFEKYCKNCNKGYANKQCKWCKSCQIDFLKNNFTNWTSGNRQIDDFIQKEQLQIESSWDIIFEWIPYNQFTGIEKIENIDTIAMWKDGPLYYNSHSNKYERILVNKNVTLKYLHKIPDILNKDLDKIKSKDIICYGMSQNPDTKDYILVSHKEYFEKYCLKCDEKYTDKIYKCCESCQFDFLKSNFTNWNDRFKQIKFIIQEKQFEWIPYNQFSNIEKVGNTGATAICLLKYNMAYNKSKTCDSLVKWKRSNGRVALRYLYNLQYISDEFLSKVKSEDMCYGITKNPAVMNYILIFHEEYFEKYCCKCCNIEYTYYKQYIWCKSCQINYLKNNFTNWTSGNKQIDDFIQKEQLQIEKPWNIFEWIPYDQLNDIKEIGYGRSTAIWENGPSYYNFSERKLIRKSNKNVVIKYLCNSQNILSFDDYLNKVKSKDICYGISQNLNTKDFVLIFHEYIEKYCEACYKEYTNKKYKWCNPCQIAYKENNFTIWTSGDSQIDHLIQEKRLQISSPQDIIFEWIPYNQFSNIKEIGNIDTIAMWKDGPLYYNSHSNKYERNLVNKNVTLKYLEGKLNNIDELLNKVESEDNSYGISQNPDTKDYMLVVNEMYCEKCGEKYANDLYKLCKPCLSNDKNVKISNFIDNSKLKWILYSQFKNVEKIGKGGFATVYSAMWNNKKVALKCLHINSHNLIDEFLNEVSAYSAYSNQDFSSNILKLYGISQKDTENYVIVLEYAEGGNFNDYLYRNYKKFNWLNRLQILIDIIRGLKEIHQKQMVHRDFHIGNILFKYIKYNDTYISDMGLCGEVGNIDETKIYGVMPYVAPEVLKGKNYTQAADIYSFAMIMYFVATGRQPFADHAHDNLLALNICNGIRPEIDKSKAPKCYIDLMKSCWDSNPKNRPDATKIEELICLFRYSYMLDASEFKLNMKVKKEQQHYEIEKQFKEADEYRKANPLLIKTTHPQAIYTSRLLNPFTGDLPEDDKGVGDDSLVKCDDNMYNNSVEITDFS
ncbi:hypothetical protein RhiirC2_140264, partial [Rhizophagus irregularis]